MLFRRDPSPLPLACRVCTLVQYVYAQTGDVCFMGSGGGQQVRMGDDMGRISVTGGHAGMHTRLPMPR